jgi:hypothetical protein
MVRRTIFCLQRDLWTPPICPWGKDGLAPSPRGVLGLDGHLLVRQRLSEIDWEGEFRGEKRRKFCRYSFEYLKPHPELELFLSGTSRYGPYVKNNLRICLWWPITYGIYISTFPCTKGHNVKIYEKTLNLCFGGWGVRKLLF